MISCATPIRRCAERKQFRPVGVPPFPFLPKAESEVKTGELFPSNIRSTGGVICYFGATFCLPGGGALRNQAWITRV